MSRTDNERYLDKRESIMAFIPRQGSYGGQSIPPSSMGSGISRGETVVKGINYIKDEHGNVVMMFGYKKDAF